VPQRNALEPLLNSRFKVFYKGELRMPESKRAWTEDDIAKLKALAGKEPGERIAAELGRTFAAVTMQASKLGLSLRTKPRSRTKTADGATAAGVP
jgi:tRNA A58 N-methylase Trm61